MKIGYAFLAGRCAFVPAPRIPAETASVKCRTLKDDRLLVPAASFPETDDLLKHAAFALAHEGVNMQILAQILPKISRNDMTSFVNSKPCSLLIRRAGWLWELFTGQSLDFRTTATKYEPLFDPASYLTRDGGERSAKWKITFNGLGTPKWCATVERTAAIHAGLSILDRAAEWFDSIGRRDAERVYARARIHETMGSFELEKDYLSEAKADRFALLLRHASENRRLSEGFLCELQNELIDNPHAQACAYRTEQNWLADGPGGHSVTYVPPPPGLISGLMSSWQEAAEMLPLQTDPIAAAAIVSFGFVYMHPFMDGNGRLSRFLIHQQLAASGKLGKDRFLPVSIAMKKHELEYLEALETFSKPARKAWQVIWTGGDPLCKCTFLGNESLYRYWDATRQVEFLYKMAAEALDVHLQDEVGFLEKFDRLDRAVNDAFDIPQPLRFRMIQVYLEHGRLSLNFRKKFVCKIQGEAMDWLEANGAALIRGDDIDL